jgi:DNA-binding CsgD family transcriptional regulator
MNSVINQMHQVWKDVRVQAKSSARLQKINFDEIISSIFTTGPFYFYVIDFSNMSISHLSSGFEDIHGIKCSQIKNINDLLDLNHPDDMDFIFKAEAKAIDFIIKKIGLEKFTSYKGSYNFRIKTIDGSYRLFNHQALAILLDENYKLNKSLNIHTDISHLTEKNNYKFSLIGLAGEESYLNMDVFNTADDKYQTYISNKIFTKRELEIIKLLAKGYSTKKISETLFISPLTVETHRKHILQKSGCENSVVLISRGITEGWI